MNRLVGFLAIPVLVAAAACNVIRQSPGPLRPGERPPAPTMRQPSTRPASDSGMTLGISRRPVSGKEAPGTLIARDGARCTVTEARFKEVAIGERVTCAWR
jgi:hypothetical protein